MTLSVFKVILMNKMLNKEDVLLLSLCTSFNASQPTKCLNPIEYKTHKVRRAVGLKIKTFLLDNTQITNKIFILKGHTQTSPVNKI